MATVIQTYSFLCIPCCPSTQKCQFCGDSDLPPTFYVTIAGCPMISTPEDYTPLNGTFLMTQGTAGGGTPDTTSAYWTYQNTEYAYEFTDPFYLCNSFSRRIEIECTATGGYAFRMVYEKDSIFSLSLPSMSCEEYYAINGGSSVFVYSLGAFSTGCYTPHNTGATTPGGLSPTRPVAESVIFYTLGPTDSCDPLYIASSGDIQLVYQRSAIGSGFSVYGLASDVSGVTVTLHP